MRFPPSLVAILALPALCPALQLPRIEFQDYVYPKISGDTLYATRTNEYKYREDPEFDSVSSLQYLAKGYRYDSAAGILRLRIHHWQSLEPDSQGRILGMHFRTDYGVDGIDEWRTELVYDDQGRLSRKIAHYPDPDLRDPDTSFYTWTHPHCADTDRPTADGFRQRATWTVDALGRCRIGLSETSYRLPTWYTNFSVHLEWGPWGPTQRSEVSQPGDTLEVHRITYDASGSPIADSLWDVDSTGRRLVETCAATVDDGWLVSRTCTMVSPFWTRTDAWTTSAASTGITPRAGQAPVQVRVRRDAERFRFLNTGSARLTLQVRTPDGARVAETVLEPGKEWIAPRQSGLLTWMAVSRDGQRSGVLPSLR